MAAKTAAKTKKTVLKTEESKGDASGAAIDHPVEGERVMPGHYAVRITATASDVAISINESEWQPCRTAVGFFWYDWSPATLGKQTLLLRTRTGKGRWKESAPRSCTVVAPKN